MIWKRLPLLLAIPFLLAVASEVQNEQGPNGPGSGSSEAKSKTYMITGAVKRPGSYPLDRRTTVLEAIKQAGGFQGTFASRKDIKIIRDEQMFDFNYYDFVRGKNSDQNKNIELEDGDVVRVPSKSAAPQSWGEKTGENGVSLNLPLFTN
jgi:SLBB domain